MRTQSTLTRAAVFALLACGGVAARAAEPVTGYEAMADWSSLSKLKTGTQTRLASSYHRGGDTLLDRNNYEMPGSPAIILRIDPQIDPVTQLEVPSPGVLTRIWMPGVTAENETNPDNFRGPPQILRIFIDGESTPSIDTTSDKFFSAQPASSGGFSAAPRFQGPMVKSLVGGKTSYEPIAFQKSIRIETEDNHDYFYQVGYQRLPAGTTVQRYTPGSMTPEQTAARAAAVATLNSPGVNPAGSAGTPQAVTGAVQPGSSLALPNLAGSGRITALTVKMRGSTAPVGAAATALDGQLDGLRVRVRYDNEATHAIDVPVSRFFGTGHGRVDYKSVPVGVKDDGTYYSYFPMPFRNGAHVELYNASGAAVPDVTLGVETQAGPVGADEAYLHAQYRHTTMANVPAAERAHHTLLDLSGRGHYVGNILSVRGSAGLLEGNDLVTADGVVLNGTGLEDAYNGGYYYNHVNFGPFIANDEPFAPYSGIGPYSGLLAYNGRDGYDETDQYRWLIADAVPFDQQLNVRLQNVGSQVDTIWDSTAFYYLSVPEPAALGLLLPIALLAARPGRRRRRD